MSSPLDPIIRRHLQWMEPIPTDVQPVLRRLEGVRAALFDIYGTLLISASGDVEASQEAARGAAFTAALAAAGVDFRGDAQQGVQCLWDQIAEEHRQASRAGIEYPEVDLVQVWRQTLVRLAGEGLAAPRAGSFTPGSGGPGGPSDGDLQRLACEYEMRVNPVWPMPGARQCLEKLQAAGLLLGLISNAQFLTLDLWRLLLEADAGGFEFDQQLQYYSYQYGRAKPGTELYELAAKGLAERGIGTAEVVYIGNDMLKDILPAGAVGFRTALFAGDARSLRRRENDLRVSGVVPDLVITELSDLPACIG
ncbi:MAG: HAD hydrolase-like protein [Planctomycetales bacterium]|nr:HAD hydrolase-like protein [Planctomycetales bacterium]NIM09484.1 HAD hydrolase-like protein [Planctomycetales bacterium]NIN08972.1 HAD hydrolase-like protein [Planctomycetales bacterium]NIN78087.1 HAD hydrolase-like protein [Planctomycetales bacterium]NIO35265.1 HAD hydrolase-like protein [Planctomycetales bacterium]